MSTHKRATASTSSLRHHQPEPWRTQSSWQVPAIAEEREARSVGPYDIVSGRHKLAFNHVGNRRFRVTVDLNLERYNSAPTKHAKSLVILSIMDLIKSNGGRFLKRKGGKWIEISDKETRQKVGHAIRDKLMLTEQKASGSAANLPGAAREDDDGDAEMAMDSLSDGDPTSQFSSPACAPFGQAASTAPPRQINHALLLSSHRAGDDMAKSVYQGSGRSVEAEEGKWAGPRHQQQQHALDDPLPFDAAARAPSVYRGSAAAKALLDLSATPYTSGCSSSLFPACINHKHEDVLDLDDSIWPSRRTEEQHSFLDLYRNGVELTTGVLNDYSSATNTTVRQDDKAQRRSDGILSAATVRRVEIFGHLSFPSDNATRRLQPLDPSSTSRSTCVPRHRESGSITAASRALLRSSFMTLDGDHILHENV